MTKSLTQIYRRNVNHCSSCKERNLPEPVAFAQLCRLTNEYVCSACYASNAKTLNAKLKVSK